MNKRDLIVGLSGLGIGVVIGYFIGKKALEKKVNEEHKAKLQDEVDQLHKDDYILKKDAESMVEDAKTTAYYDGKNDQHKIDYESFLKQQKYIEDPDDPNILYENEDVNTDVGPDSDETEEDDSAPAKPVIDHSRTPKILGQNEFDPDDPDIDFTNVQDLFYYTQSDMLVDEEGHILEEKDTIGSRPRGTGFLKGGTGDDEIWVRNYAKETDYLLHRRDCAVEDDFEVEEVEETADEDNE